VGDPGTDGTYPAHTKDIERDVLAWYANLFRAPPDWTGYTTSGGTEGVLTGLLHARTALPEAVVYATAAAHYSVAKAAVILRLPLVQVAATVDGEMDYSSLRAHAEQHSGQAAVVIATIGTTMTEAVDSVPLIHAALDVAGIRDRWIHADAALAGLPLALRGRRDFDLAPGGADSISTSGHKWWGTPIPCGITLSRRPHPSTGRPIDYIGSHDTTITGSRAGLAPLMLWHAITRHDDAGHRRRACRGDEVAAYAHQRLIALGWPCWRNLDALTVRIRPLPESLRDRWPLPVDGGWSHLICMPGRTRQHIDQLIADLRRELPRSPLNATPSAQTAHQLVG
jgi:histidine decarboxylase